MTVCINFYGLTRNVLHKTHESIKTNILDPLTAEGLQYEIYLHTYNLKKLSMSRSGEKNITLKPGEWKLLKPNHVSVTSQDEFDKTFDYATVRRYGDAWKTDFQNTYGMIRQLNS